METTSDATTAGGSADAPAVVRAVPAWALTPAGLAVAEARAADQRAAAIHEAGHLLVLSLLGRPVASVSIRSHAGGRTEVEDADTSPAWLTAPEIRALAAADLAGLAAEALVGEPTDGSARDLRNATRRAVLLAENGLIAGLQPVALDMLPYAAVPERAAEALFAAVASELAAARDCADALLRPRADALLALAARLFEARRLDGADIDAALRAVGVTPPPRRP